MSIYSFFLYVIFHALFLAVLAIRDETFVKLSLLSSALLLATIPTSLTFAAGLERSNQSINAFLQTGNYAEAGISGVVPSVKGKDAAGHKVSNMADGYIVPNAALKVQATDHISLGLIYDQPFGADSTYAVENSLFSDGKESTNVDVNTNNLTMLVGYQPNENWNIYGGAVWQTVEADIQLRGQAYSLLSGYDIKLKNEDAWGWLAGFAYSKPEIGLRAALTYRSEIEHNARSQETSNLPLYAGKLGPGSEVLSYLGSIDSTVQAVTPQSVNFDFQTGITQKTLATASVRWVHWDQFKVTPDLLATATGMLPGVGKQNLIDYKDDQWTINLGLSHKFTDKWAGSAGVGWDSGAGNPVTILGPTKGYWSVGLGGQYSPTPSTFIAGGVKYFGLGDAKAQTAGQVKGDFTDNYAIGYGVKVGYKF